MANTKQESLASCADAYRKDLGRCCYHRRPQGVVLQILFGNKCVDEVEMPQVLYEHPFRVAREVDRTSRRKQEYVHRDPCLQVVDVVKMRRKKARNPARNGRW